MSIRQTSIEFEVPRSTLDDRVSGRYSIETNPGKKPVIPTEIEGQMVTRVMNNFKDGLDWLAGLRRRYPMLVLRKTEKLSTVQSRMLNPITVGRCFADLHKYSNSLKPIEI